jgi:hypothetical protein
MAQWTIPPEKMAEVPKELISAVRRVYTFEIFNKVVGQTPVDTGAARQNWLVTTNEETYEFDPSKLKGQDVLEKGRKVIDQAEGDDTIFIQNNAPYILEYGGYGKGKGQGKSLKGKPSPLKGKTREEISAKVKHSKSKITADGFSLQAPQGMVGLTMAEADRIFDEAVKAVKGW